MPSRQLLRDQLVEALDFIGHHITVIRFRGMIESLIFNSRWFLKRYFMVTSQNLLLRLFLDSREGGV